LDGFTGAPGDINDIDGRSKVKDRLNTLIDSGVDLQLTNMASPIFKRNLRKIDSSMPLFIGQFLVQFFCGNARSVADLTALIAEQGTAKDSLGEPFNFEDLKYKVLSKRTAVISSSNKTAMLFVSTSTIFPNWASICSITLSSRRDRPRSTNLLRSMKKTALLI